MDKTAIVTCTCDHEYQDSVLGKGRRHTTPVNPMQRKGRFVVRCTVCRREHDLGLMSGAKARVEDIES